MSETTSPNTTIAQYLIVSRIGAGGMGEEPEAIILVLNWTAGLKK